VTDEYEKEATESLEEAVEVNKVMHVLLRSEGWAIIAKTLEAKLAGSRNLLELTPLESTLEIGKQEYLKGEIATTRLLLALPTNMIDHSQDVIDAYEREEEDDD